MIATIKYRSGDSVEVLRTISEKTVHCVVTSPPYDNLRAYGGHTWDFKGTAMELYRVLHEGGIVCWNVGDSCLNGSETLTSMKHAIYFVEEVGFRMHDTMIWKKPNFSNPSHNRYHQLWEYIFVLSKGSPQTFNPIKDKPNKYTGSLGKNTFRTARGNMQERKVNECGENGMRGNVWEGNTRGQEELCKSLPHPAMMPKWMARDLILSWSNPGDTILDPFAGSGTTGHQAIAIGRNAILIDIEPHYAQVSDQQPSSPGLALA